MVEYLERESIMNTLYEAGKDEGCLGINFKWRCADEVLKLIGNE